MSSALHQLSIFLENKKGSLYEVMDILSQADIRIIAATVADTSEFGILRLITTDSEKAYDVLKAANKNANRNEVIAVLSEPSAGQFNEKLKFFASEDIAIEYMYCFSSKQGKSVLIIRVNETEKALKVIEKNNIQTLSDANLTEF